MSWLNHHKELQVIDASIVTPENSHYKIELPVKVYSCDPSNRFLKKDNPIMTIDFCKRHYYIDSPFLDCKRSAYKHNKDTPAHLSDITRKIGELYKIWLNWVQDDKFNALDNGMYAYGRTPYFNTIVDANNLCLISVSYSHVMNNYKMSSITIDISHKSASVCNQNDEYKDFSFNQISKEMVRAWVTEFNTLCKDSNKNDDRKVKNM